MAQLKHPIPTSVNSLNQNILPLQNFSGVVQMQTPSQMPAENLHMDVKRGSNLLSDCTYCKGHHNSDHSVTLRWKSNMLPEAEGQHLRQKASEMVSLSLFCVPACAHTAMQPANQPPFLCRKSTLFLHRKGVLSNQPNQSICLKESTLKLTKLEHLRNKAAQMLPTPTIFGGKNMIIRLNANHFLSFWHTSVLLFEVTTSSCLIVDLPCLSPYICTGLLFISCLYSRVGLGIGGSIF